MSRWSQLVYTRLHHEPFIPQAEQWEFAGTGPLSGANGALPWILFHRDRPQFEREFPHWKIEAIQPDMPFAYLFSGGVGLRSLLPGWCYNLCRMFERSLNAKMDQLAMFALIVLKRI